MASRKLHLVPLGGVGEFGMNCSAVRWGDDIIVVNTGIMFPEGVIVVPDIFYLICIGLAMIKKCAGSR